MAELQDHEGHLVLTGDQVEHIANSYPHPKVNDSRPSPHVIVVATKQELATLSQSRKDRFSQSISSPTLYAIGLGTDVEKKTFFVARKQAGLGPCDLYIHLAGPSNDRIPTGIDTLATAMSTIPTTDVEFLDQLTLTLHLTGKYETALIYGAKLVSLDSSRGFVRVADSALLLGRFKLAMLAYACALQSINNTYGPEKAKTYALKKLIQCSAHTEWGCVFQEHEERQIPSSLRTDLLRPWPQDLREIIRDSELSPTFRLESRYRLPRFFRWLVPFSVAIMSTPKNVDDIMALASQELGIRHVITLTEEEPLSRAWFHARKRNIRNTHFSVPNYHPPSIEQMDLIMKLIQDPENRPILIHCGGGKGRAGTVAACYLAAYGFRTPEMAPSEVEPVMSAQDAIVALRNLRPGSLETKEQERFVSTWVSAVWKRRSIIPQPDVFEPPPSPFEIVEGALDTSQDNLFVLIGLPGSGKSSFSASLKARDQLGWKIVSQDESGSKQSSETDIGRDPSTIRGKRTKVLLDRCNTSVEQRRHWHSLTSNWVRRASRTGHLTLPPGPRVRSAFEEPSLSAEPYFSAIVRISSIAAAEELIRKLSPPSSLGLFKYPRTPHLINLGAVADDDILTTRASLFNLPSTSVGTAPSNIHVVITEKTDGANLGLSLSPSKELLIQNRAHYVNPSTHAQFKHLGTWIEKHREDLYSILDRDNEWFPERWVLFGEWVYATHSIRYSHLPDLFLAFDLYDRSTESWMDRATLLSLFEGTSLQAVRTVYEGDVIPSEEELIGMTSKQSNFYDGPVEGIYVYVERGGRVVQRGKVVRSDFICGNAHWSKGPLEMNGMEEGVL
ncbi:ATP dependent DNA ligase [Flagelloscypha sp. PMI_526]|nr:ATP dependent DNA ligase [Flagelloscypha sp. PMI_526]